jgi:hypothetical protein
MQMRYRTTRDPIPRMLMLRLASASVVRQLCVRQGLATDEACLGAVCV